MRFFPATGRCLQRIWDLYIFRLNGLSGLCLPQGPFPFAGNSYACGRRRALEFTDKWKQLCESHLEEGIREPVLVYEYMNRFYVLEGNKRVSVLKF